MDVFVPSHWRRRSNLDQAGSRLAVSELCHRVDARVQLHECCCPSLLPGGRGVDRHGQFPFLRSHHFMDRLRRGKNRRPRCELPPNRGMALRRSGGSRSSRRLQCQLDKNYSNHRPACEPASIMARANRCADQRRSSWTRTQWQFFAPPGGQGSSREAGCNLHCRRLV